MTIYFIVEGKLCSCKPFWPITLPMIAVDSFIYIPNILFNSFINPAANCGPLSKITLSGNPCNFHTLSLNNLADPSAIIFSVVAIKCDIFKNLSHTTKIESWSLDTSNFVIKSTNICCYSLSNIMFGLSFSADISALFFIFWYWSHPSTYCFTFFVTPGY